MNLKCGFRISSVDFERAFDGSTENLIRVELLIINSFDLHRETFFFFHFNIWLVGTYIIVSYTYVIIKKAK